MASVKRKWTEIKDSFKEEIEDMGGLHIFLLTLLFTIIVLPFILLYLFVLKPIYLFIRMLFDIKELGLKTSYRKNFHPIEYQEEQIDIKYEKEKKIEERYPKGRKKQFRDWKYWPDAYVIDGVAVYGAEGRTLLYVDENVEEFDVPEGVVNIYHRCFACCDKLKRVSLPSSLRRIGGRAFFSCVSLEEIIVPESVDVIYEETFVDCASLKRVVLPSQTTEIPKRMFYNCRSMEMFHLPEEVNIIGTEAFSKCYSLEHIEMNEKLAVIRKKAFEDCRSLKEFLMPESVSQIMVGFFNGCHSLQHIHFSSQIKDFGGSCCHECWNISQISMTPMSEEDKNYIRELWEKCSTEYDITKSEHPYPESSFWSLGDTLYYGVPRLSQVCLVFCFSKEKEFAIPSFVTNIKPEAFVACKNLRTLRLSPFIITSSDPFELNTISYSFIYDYWPQVKDIIFDESLKSSKCAFGLIPMKQ